jgi:hypothetical protein
VEPLEVLVPAPHAAHLHGWEVCKCVAEATPKKLRYNTTGKIYKKKCTFKIKYQKKHARIRTSSIE